MTTETTNEVAEVTQQTVKEVSRFAQYIQDNIPTLIGFGIRVLLALVVLLHRPDSDQMDTQDRKALHREIQRG